MVLYDVVVVLGARIGLNEEGKMVLAPHAEARAVAAGLIWRKGLVKKLIICGGHAIGVRYPIYLSDPIFGRKESDYRPDFSDGARKIAKLYPSEASLIAEFLINHYGVPRETMILEECSTTTSENVYCIKPMLERIFAKDIGVISNHNHLERAVAEFQKIGLIVEPIATEKIVDFLWEI